MASAPKLRCPIVVALALFVLGLPGGLRGQDGGPAREPEPKSVESQLSLREEVRRSGPSHAFTRVSGGVPRIFFGHRTREIPLVLRNDGQVPWLPGRGFALSYHWLSLDGEVLQEGGYRTPIEEPTPTGETVSLTARLGSPSSWGLRRIRLDVVEEHERWSSDVDPSPEPARLALVLPPPGVLVGGLVPAAAALLGLVLVCWRSGPKPVRALAAWADLVWCGAALAWKPRILYEELQLGLSEWVPWTTLSSVALALLFLVWLPRRVRSLVAWLLAAFASLYLWGDLIHYRFFGDLASTSTLLGAHQTGELGESIGYLAQAGDLWLVPDLLLALPLVLAIWWPRRGSAEEGEPVVGSSRILSRRVVATLLLLALIPGIARIWRETTQQTGRLRKTRPPIQETEEDGIWGFQLQDLVNQARRRWIRRPLKAEELEGLVSWFEERAPERQGREPWAGLANGRNLLLLQVESLQSFVPGFSWQGQAVTPNLDHLAASALVFTEFQDQTSKGRSSDADFVAFTSLLPVADSVAYEFVANDHATLVDAVREMGYTTLSAVPFRPSFWNRQLTHPAYGFEESLFVDDFELVEKIGWGLNDRDFFRQMLPRLQALPTPFCAWLTTLSVHYPYRTFPDEHKVLDLGPWEGTSLGNYLHGMSFFDRALGELWAGLERTGLLEDTVVVLWGDHDSTLHLRKEFARPLGIRSPVPGRFLADQVPFLIRMPGPEAPSGEIDSRSGHLDIAPTLLSLVGGDPGSMPWAGRNLLGEPTPAPAVHPRGSWVDDEHVFLASGGELDQGECWDHDRWVEVPVGECAAGHEAASQQLEVSELVLRYDLQRRIGEALRERVPTQEVKADGVVGILPAAPKTPLP